MGKQEVLGAKTTALPLCPPQIPHGLASDLGLSSRLSRDTSCMLNHSLCWWWYVLYLKFQAATILSGAISYNIARDSDCHVCLSVCLPCYITIYIYRWTKKHATPTVTHHALIYYVGTPVHQDVLSFFSQIRNTIFPLYSQIWLLFIFQGFVDVFVEL
jgi:hypothetical protein